MSGGDKIDESNMKILFLSIVRKYKLEKCNE